MSELTLGFYGSSRVASKPIYKLLKMLYESMQTDLNKYVADQTKSLITPISDNTSAAQSRIQNTDFVNEIVSRNRNQVLQQMSTATLSQAHAGMNQTGALALLSLSQSSIKYVDLMLYLLKESQYENRTIRCLTTFFSSKK